MNASISEWRKTYEDFESQVKEFNKKIRQENFPSTELDRISHIVQDEVNRLNELYTALIKRKEDITRPTCCGRFSRTVWTLSILSGVAKVVSVAGAAIATFEGDNLATKWTGFTACIVSASFDFAATTYTSRLCLISDEASQLAILTKEGVDHAEIFKTFIEQLRDINSLEAKLLEESKELTSSPALSGHEVVPRPPSSAEVDLDQRISKCLNNYEELPPCYRREDVYASIISHLIHKLPPSDPLHIGLRQLEPTTMPEDFSQRAAQTLPVRYFSTSVQTMEAFDSPLRQSNWNGEAHPLPLDNREPLTPLNSPGTYSDYRQQIAQYENLVRGRFKLRHPIPYFETKGGWALSSITGASRLSSRVDSHEPITPVITIREPTPPDELSS